MQKKNPSYKVFCHSLFIRCRRSNKVYIISLIGQSFDLYLTTEEGEREKMKAKMEREW